ncbi:hypothetical protein JMN32_06175 [Fulvivirga sp. 29W222]|uniref:Uncharacterized protein n=1 Tax=Fulvivirga marina TaxID=2494733 RepID=A0A937FTU6_9BACT|nr:hypothetical protein [Fulvivirga marina]MBL6445885.1 hypothetical protein [Fulvivirga marina]
MKIRKITVVALMALFGLAFTACQEEEVGPSNDQLLETEGDKGDESGPREF